MKKRNSVLMILGVLFTLILSGCNFSEKGNWTESDKQKFMEDMNGVEGLSAFKDNKDKWIDCYLSKCEARFSSYREANNNEDECRRLALECNKEVLSNGSVKGRWSEKDKRQFHEDMDGIEALSNFGESRNKWVECYLRKLETNYASYYEANLDTTGCEKLTKECSAETL